jgi:hypothetical protein
MLRTRRDEERQGKEGVVLTSSLKEWMRRPRICITWRNGLETFTFVGGARLDEDLSGAAR